MLVAAAAKAAARTPVVNSLAAKAERDELKLVADNDPTMAAAMAKARATLPKFLELAQSPRPGMEGFAVKVAIQGDCGAEYFWIYPFTYVQGAFSGRLNNTPRSITHVKMGDQFTFSEGEIVDWMYMDRERMHGNYTARAMLKNASPEERAAFRKRFGLDPDF